MVRPFRERVLTDGRRRTGRAVFDIYTAVEAQSAVQALLLLAYGVSPPDEGARGAADVGAVQLSA